ncbi:MAG: efflux transporter permease, partial [Firmicutes bacterium]|nr:efflux transporter permease [Bacillota bacterium]
LTVHSMAPLARSMGTPDVLHFMPAVGGLVFAVVLPVAALFAALAAWRAVALRPAAMLGEGFGAPRTRMPLSVRVLTALRLPVPALLGIKDAMARPARAVMTILSLMVCLLTITQGMNFPGLAASVMAHQEWIGKNWDMTVQFKGVSRAATEDALRKLPEVKQYYREMFHAATMVEQEFDLNVRAVDGDRDWEQLGFRLLEGRMPNQPGEILLAPRAWERLAATVGSKLLMQVGNNRLPVTVVGKYQDTINDGRMALTSFATLDQFALPPGELQPFLRVKFAPGADWVAIRHSLQTDSRVLATLEDRELPDFARDGLPMIRLLGWLMAGIAALSMMGAALLTAREQMREVGIRKAIGMTPAQVLGSVAAGGAWFGLVAAVLALPVSYLVHTALISMMGAVMSVGRIPLELSGSIVLRSSGFGIILAVAAVLPAAAWGARLVTARVLHAE